MRKTAIAAVLICAGLLAATIVSPAVGGPSIGSVAKTAKKALKTGKAAKRSAASAKRTADAAWSVANNANGKADQALARPAITANGITPVTSPTTSIAPGDVGGASAVCPGGQRAISGGGSMISGLGDGLAISEAGTDRGSWFVVAANNSEFTTAEIEAVAYCAPAGGAVAARRSTEKAAMQRAIRHIQAKRDAE